MLPVPNDLRQKLHDHGQEHVLAWWDRLSAAEGERLAAEASLFDLGLAADAVRKRKHPHDVVTYIVDRNVNYTNVCTTSCRFCAFYRPLGHPEGYVLSREQLSTKLQEVVDAGGVQILLQGGLHPELRIEWYEDLFRWIKHEFALGLHAGGTVPLDVSVSRMVTGA